MENETIDKIIEAVCTVFGVTREQLMSRGRTLNLADARQVAMERVYAMTRFGIHSVAIVFNRHHSLIAKATRAVHNKFTDPIFASRYEQVNTLLGIQKPDRTTFLTL